MTSILLTESHIYKNILENKKKKERLEWVSQYNTEGKKACIITFVSQSNNEYFHISAS